MTRFRTGVRKTEKINGHSKTKPKRLITNLEKIFKTETFMIEISEKAREKISAFTCSLSMSLFKCLKITSKKANTLEQILIKAGEKARVLFENRVKAMGTYGLALTKHLSEARHHGESMKSALAAFLMPSFYGKGRYHSIRTSNIFNRISEFVKLIELEFIILGDMIEAVCRNGISMVVATLNRAYGRFGGHKFDRRLVAGALTLSAALCAAYFTFNITPNAYAIVMDGKKVAVVEDYVQMEKVVKEYLNVNSDYFENIHYTNDLEYKPVRASKNEIADRKALLDVCEDMDFVSVGTVMYVDGKKIATLKDEAEGEKIIDEVVDSYAKAAANSGVKMGKYKIKEDIKYEVSEVNVGDFSDSEKVVKILLDGSESQATYTVKENDTLSGIAEKNGITVSELKKYNPKFNNETAYLQIGEKLKLNVVEKLLHINVSGKLVAEEQIKYETRYKTDTKLWKGQQKTISEGEFGTKKVEYTVAFENGELIGKKKVDEKIVSAPIDKVVAKGTKYVISSRGSSGDGNVGGSLAWPTSGSISSYFGSRGRGYHTGLDIATHTGTRVVAAESGTVVSAGWGGGYGNMIKIDHGDGVQTWYAHLSRISVSVGENVSRGEVIGSSGNTGNSTGPHLHFEVRINGSARNPLKYLN